MRRLYVAVSVIGLVACGKVSGISIDGGVNPDGALDAPIDAAPPFLSCYGLAATCGSGGNDSCCSSPAVPGGSYFRSFDVAGDGLSGKMIYPATVSSFAFDKYEVTVGRFRAFVNTGLATLASPPMPGDGAHANIAGSGWDANWNVNLAADKAALVAALKCNSTFQMWTDTPGPNERRPINCVTWYEAMVFCAWDGGYLPTEAEWNYAATGGAQQRAYPWSNPAGTLTIDGSRASYNDGTGCIGDGSPGCTAADVVPVGSKPEGNGLWGQSDLAGNVWEWTLDWYAPYATPCTDCANLTTASNRVIRGGSFDSSAGSSRAVYRITGYPPTSRLPNIGFRCARKS